MNPPKPTSLKILQGNPGKRPLNALEPKPIPGEPDLPPDLNGAEADVWRELIPILSQMGVLTVADGMALAWLCRLEVCLSKAIQELNATLRQANDTGKLGFLMGSKKGQGNENISVSMRANPLVNIVIALQAAHLSMLREFGLTPSSRTKIAASKEAGNGDIEDALCA